MFLLCPAPLAQQQHPPHFVKDLEPLTAIDSDQVTMSATVIGNPPPDVTWYHDNRPIGQNSDFSVSYNKDTGVTELYIIECFTEDTGVFKCVARNPIGESSSSAKLTVIEPTDFLKDVSDTDVSMPEVYMSEENLQKTEVMFQPKQEEDIVPQQEPIAFAPPAQPPASALHVEPLVVTETRMTVDGYSDAAFLNVPVIRKTTKHKKKSQEALHSETESEVETLDIIPVKRQSPPKTKGPRYQETIIKEKKPQPVEFQFQFSEPSMQSSYTETESDFEPNPWSSEYTSRTTSHRVYRRGSVPSRHTVEIPVDHQPTVRTEVTRYIVAEPEDRPIWIHEPGRSSSTSTERKHSRTSNTMRIEEIYESDAYDDQYDSYDRYDRYDRYERDGHDRRGRRPLRVKRYYVEVPDRDEYYDFDDAMCSETETVEETTKRRIIEEETTTRRRSSTRRYYPGYFSDSEVSHIRRAAPKRKHKVRVIHYIPVTPAETRETVQVVRRVPVNQRPPQAKRTDSAKLTTVVSKTSIPVKVIKTTSRTDTEQMDTEESRQEFTEKRRRISTPSKEVTRTRVEKQILIETPCTSTEAIDTQTQTEHKEERHSSSEHEETETKVENKEETDVTETTTTDVTESTTVKRKSVTSTATPPTFVQPIQPQIVKEHGTCTFRCKIAGNPMPQVTWYWDFRKEDKIALSNKDHKEERKIKSHKIEIPPSPKITKHFDSETGVCSLVIENVTEEEATNVTCEATNPAGRASCTANLVVVRKYKLKYLDTAATICNCFCPLSMSLTVHMRSQLFALPTDDCVFTVLNALVTLISVFLNVQVFTLNSDVFLCVVTLYSHVEVKYTEPCCGPFH